MILLLLSWFDFQNRKIIGVYGETNFMKSTRVTFILNFTNSYAISAPSC